MRSALSHANAVNQRASFALIGRASSWTFRVSSCVPFRLPNPLSFPLPHPAGVRCAPVERGREREARTHLHSFTDPPPLRIFYPTLGDQYTVDMATDKSTKASDNRRSNKPIMEKRRRARINSCLNDLKTLILEAMKKDPARHSKLEKADILEMTVKYLQNLQRQQVALATATDPGIMSKYRAGFGECANEVSRYMARLDGMDGQVRSRLLNHLSACLSSLSPQTSGAPVVSPVHIQIPAGPVGVMPQEVVSGIQLVPSRLATGELAFLLPTTASQAASATTAHLMPIYSTATRTASPVSSNTSTLSPAGSDFSDTSVSSPTPSPAAPSFAMNPADCPQNLSLPKEVIPMDSDTMWRPW